MLDSPVPEGPEDESVPDGDPETLLLVGSGPVVGEPGLVSPGSEGLGDEAVMGVDPGVTVGGLLPPRLVVKPVVSGMLEPAVSVPEGAPV